MPRALAPDRDHPEPDEHWNNYNVSATYALCAVREQLDREAGRRPSLDLQADVGLSGWFK